MARQKAKGGKERTGGAPQDAPEQDRSRSGAPGERAEKPQRVPDEFSHSEPARKGKKFGHN